MVYGGFSLIFQKGESSLFMFFGKGESEVYVLNTVPVIIYLDVISDRDKILNENRGKSGIYRWTNVNSKKSYVGSSSDLARRLQCYLSTNYMLSYKSKSKIYSSLLKHGYNAFTLDILEYCEKEELIIREQYYLDKLSPSYNILKTAGSSLGFTHSEETNSNVSVNNTKEKHPFFGKKHSEISRASMILNSKTALAVDIIDTINGEVKSFRSNSEAARFFKVSEWSIRSYKKSGKLYLNRYIIKKKKPEKLNWLSGALKMLRL
jgi:hypothetical protein